MKKMFLLLTLSLFSSIDSQFRDYKLPEIKNPKYSQGLLEDISYGANVLLFGLKNNFDFTKWDKRNRAYIDKWNSDIDLIIEYITKLNDINFNLNEVIKYKTVKLKAINDEIINTFTTFPDLKKQAVSAPNISDVSVEKQLDATSQPILKMSNQLNIIYKIVNVEIPKTISELNGVKTKTDDDVKAKNLLIDIYKLLQTIGNKIIIDYSFTQEEALKQIDSMYKTIFEGRDFKKGISEANIPGMNALFGKLYFLINYSDNKDLIKSFGNIINLYFTVIGKINVLAKFEANQDLTSQSKLFKFKESFDNWNSDLKQFGKDLNDIKIPNTPAAKNAVAILKQLLKLYEPILTKIKTTFVPTYDDVMKAINLVMGNLISSDLEFGFDNKSIESLNNTLRKIQLFVEFSGSQDLPPRFAEYKKYLGEIVDRFNYIANDSKAKKDPAQLKLLFVWIYNHLNTTKNLVNEVTTILPGPREAKKVMLAMVEKYKILAEQFQKSLEAPIGGKFKDDLNPENKKKEVIKYKDLLKELNDRANYAFLSREVDLTKPSLFCCPRGLSPEGLDSWGDALKNVENFVIASKETNFYKFVDPKEPVSIWSINKKIIELIDDISKLVNLQNPAKRVEKVKTVEDVMRVRESYQAEFKPLSKEFHNEILWKYYNPASVEINALIKKLDDGISITTILKPKTEAKNLLKQLGLIYGKILQALKEDIDTLLPKNQV